MSVVVPMGHVFFSPFVRCNLDLSRVDYSREGSNGLKMYMWQLIFLRICTSLVLVIYIGWCHDLWFFCMTMGSTFQYRNGKMKNMKFTESLFRVGVAVM